MNRAKLCVDPSIAAAWQIQARALGWDCLVAPAGAPTSTLDDEAQPAYALLVVEGIEVSLRLVAECDAQNIAIVALQSEAADAQSQSALTNLIPVVPRNAGWTQVLDFAGLTELQPRSESADDARGNAPGAIDAGAVGKLVTVWGPAGAPGRTSVAINLAAEFSSGGLRTLLVDADTYGGAIAGMLELFDETPGFLAACRLASANALTDQELARLVHVFPLGDSHLSILTGIVNPARWPEISSMRIRAALEALRQRFDVIVADVGFNLEEDEEIVSDVTAPRRNQATIELVRRADELVAVAGPDVVSLARYIHALPTLCEVSDGARLSSVVNRVDARGSSGSAAVHTLARFAGVTQAWVIDDDPATFRRALDKGLPLAVGAPTSKVRYQIYSLALRVMPTKSSETSTKPLRRRIFQPREPVAG